MNELFIADGENNRVTAVTLFSYRAHVTRQSRFQVGVGVTRLAMEFTACEVEEDSAQARVLGSGEILAVQIRTRPSEEITQRELKEADEEERNLLHEKDELEARQKSLARQQSLLDAIADFSQVQVPREIQTHLPDRENLQHLMSYLDENGASLIEREQQLAQRLESVNEALNRVRRLLKQLRKQPLQDHKVVEVLFNSEAEQEITVEASYLVGMASWTPLYKVNVPSDLTGVELSRYAAVTQESGEEWCDIDLTFSDAVPSRTGDLPEARSWLLSDKPTRRKLYTAGIADNCDAEEGKVALAALSDAEPLASGPEAEHATAGKSEHKTSFEYHISHPVTLKCDSSEGLLPIDRTPLEGEFYYYAAPRTDPLTYLVFAAQPGAEWPAGKINIHFDGRFVGRSWLNERKAGAEMRFNLGPDRGVKVSLLAIADKKSETFFGKMERHYVERNLHYRIQAENLKSEEIDLWIYDPVPVSRTDRFQVKDLQLTPPPERENWLGREGVMGWHLQPQAGELKTIEIRYSVKHPKDRPPHGL